MHMALAFVTKSLARAVSFASFVPFLSLVSSAAPSSSSCRPVTGEQVLSEARCAKAAMIADAQHG